MSADRTRMDIPDHIRALAAQPEDATAERPEQEGTASRG